MKRIGNIYEKICDIENIKLAIMKSSLGKRNHHQVKRVLDNIDECSLSVQRMLIRQNYRPSPYIIKNIQDGATQKVRTIHKPAYYPDQIIHWALMLQIQPVIERGMYRYTCGSVPGRGTSDGQKVIRKWLDNDKKNTKYCLKMDISKFYPSVDNEILKTMFRRKIKDEKCLCLVDTIIDSSKGLPIGNYTSQWFANFFLEGLDHYIKEKLGVKYYIRYVDDLVLFGTNKKKLHKSRMAIAEYLNKINLKMKSNWQVLRVDVRPVDFLGFKFYRNKTILRKRNALRIKRRIKKIGKKNKLNYRDSCAVISYWGWIKRSDSYNFYHKHVIPYISVAEARKVVRWYAKKNSVCRDSGVRPGDTVCDTSKTG